MSSTKNKNSTKKSYIKFLISKQVEQSEKKIQKINIKELKDINQPQIKNLTKQILKSKEKVKTYIDIMQNLENPHYIELLGEEFQTLEQLEEFMTKQIPENMTIIEPETGPKHLLIEEKVPILKTQKNIWTYISGSIDQIIKDTEFYWNSFRIEEVINMQNNAQKNNEIKIIQKTKQNLQSLFKTHQIDMRFCIPPNCSNLKAVIENTIKAYTGSFYKVINNASTSKDIVILRGIKYLFQILIKNYRNGLYGTPLANKINLYRNITLPKDLFNLYKKNGIIYFTNLTSASKKNLKGFGGSGGNGLIKVMFVINLLHYSDQKSNKFFSGLDIAAKSYIPDQQQVLIFPFQFFLITNIKQNSAHEYEIHLQEIKSKAVIQKMEQPIKKNVKKCSFNKNHIKQKLQKITEKQKSIIQQKVAAKKSLLEEFKQKMLEISGQQYVISNITSQNIPINMTSPSKPIHNPQTTSISQTQIVPGKANQSLFIQILDKQAKKEINKTLIKKIQQMKQVTIQTAIKQQKQKQKQKIVNIQKLVKECKNFNQILLQLDKQTQNINQTYKITKTQKQFKKQLIINQVIDSVSKEDQHASDEKLNKLSVQMNQNKIQFHNLNIKTNVDVQPKEYVIMALQEAFKMINQKTIILDSLPSSLYKFYIERMTVGDINKFIYKFYFYLKKSQAETKSFIQKKFKQKFSKNGQYIKISIQKADKLSIALIESSQNYDRIHEMIIKTQEGQYLSFIKGLSTVKYSNLVYCDQMLDKRGNNDYIKNNYPMQLRGRQDYHFPNGTLRVGIRVWDAYENNLWMTMNNSAGQWPVVYTSFAEITLNSTYYGLTNDNNVSKPYYSNISQNAINCTSDFNLLSQHLPKVQVNGQLLYLGFQCRVDPNELQYSNKNKKYCYIDRNKSKSIRPYGIIMKKA